jgi:hypothetical protein
MLQVTKSDVFSRFSHHRTAPHAITSLKPQVAKCHPICGPLRAILCAQPGVCTKAIMPQTAMSMKPSSAPGRCALAPLHGGVTLPWFTSAHEALWWSVRSRDTGCIGGRPCCPRCAFSVWLKQQIAALRIDVRLQLWPGVMESCALLR